MLLDTVPCFLCVLNKLGGINGETMYLSIIFQFPQQKVQSIPDYASRSEKIQGNYGLLK